MKYAKPYKIKCSLSSISFFTILFWGYFISACLYSGYSIYAYYKRAFLVRLIDIVHSISWYAWLSGIIAFPFMTIILIFILNRDNNIRKAAVLLAIAESIFILNYRFFLWSPLFFFIVVAINFILLRLSWLISRRSIK